MHCCIPTPTTDSNTSTGMIWVTLNMPSAADRQGISHCPESGPPVLSVPLLDHSRGQVMWSAGMFLSVSLSAPLLLHFLTDLYET